MEPPRASFPPEPLRYAGGAIIRRALVTPANVHDSAAGDALICGDEAKVFADKAYHSQERRDLLKLLLAGTSALPDTAVQRINAR